MDSMGIYKVLGILTTAYPKYYRGLSTQEIDDTAALWFDMFSDMDEHICLMAVKKAIATSVYPPTIAEIRKACFYIQQPKTPDAGEAWAEVIRAIRRFGYMRQREALDSLSALTRKVVQRMGWAEICQSETPMVDRAHFLKLYDATCKADQEYQQLPESIRMVLPQMGFSCEPLDSVLSVIGD